MHSIVSTSLLIRAFALLASALIGFPAFAQADYPSHEIRLIVPWSAGGAIDLTARRLASLAGAQGVNIFIENLPGASGGIGMAKVAAASPDGYTLGLATTSQLALVAQGLTRTRNDEFSYLNQVAIEKYVLVVPNTSPAKDVGTFIAMMRDKPGQVSIGTAGSNNVPHILANNTAGAAGVKYIQVPYPGSTKIITDLIGGQIDAGIFKPLEAKGQIDAGMVRAIGVYDAERVGIMPGVSTFKDAGVDIFPDGPLTQLDYLVGPAKIPAGIQQKIIAIFQKALGTKEFQDFATQNGFAVPDRSGPALRAEVDAVQDTLNKVAPKVFRKSD